MPYKCCVPGCKGNYNRSTKACVFSFPRDSELRGLWLQSIPRRNFKPTDYSKVCEKHFLKDFITWETLGLDSKTGRILTAPLPHPRLKAGAVPTIFPKCSTCLSKSKRTKCRKCKESKFQSTDDTNVKDLSPTLLNRQKKLLALDCGKEDILANAQVVLNAVSKQYSSHHQVVLPALSLKKEEVGTDSSLNEPEEETKCDARGSGQTAGMQLHSLERNGMDNGKKHENVLNENKNIDVGQLNVTKTELESLCLEIKTETLDIVDELGQTTTTLSSLECKQDFEEEHLYTESTTPLGNKDSSSCKLMQDCDLPSEVDSPVSKVTLTSDSKLKRPQRGPRLATRSHSSNLRRTKKLYLALIPRTAFRKGHKVISLTIPSSAAAPSPSPPSTSSTSLPSCTVDSSETFTVSLAHIPETQRMEIKKKMLELVHQWKG